MSSRPVVPACLALARLNLSLYATSRVGNNKHLDLSVSPQPTTVIISGCTFDIFINSRKRIISMSVAWSVICRSLKLYHVTPSRGHYIRPEVLLTAHLWPNCCSSTNNQPASPHVPKCSKLFLATGNALGLAAISFVVLFNAPI